MRSRRSFLALLAAPALQGARRDGEKPLDLLSYAGDHGETHEVHSLREWRIRRAHILAGMQEAMGPLPPKPSGAPKMEVLEEAAEEGFSRKKIRYEAEPGDWVPAWLMIPKTLRGRARAMVCLHQTVRIGKDEPAGLGGKPNLHYARELAQRGFVVIAPDYPNFGEYKIDPYAKGYISATMKGIHNHRRAVDLLSRMREVDARRIGVCGHSLGGHNSLFLASFDERVKAVVTSCGFNAFPKYYGGNLNGWSHKGYMPRIAEVYEKSAAKMPFDFPEILGVIAPRAVFINAPTRDANFEVSGVDDCVKAAKPVYERIFHRADALVVEHPDAEHDFPPEVRQRAYAFLEKSL